MSFDFAYTKAVEPGGQAQETKVVNALVLVDSSTNFAGCVPIAKNDFDVMIREILQFCQILGHGECNLLCDNEPSILQVQKRAVHARCAMGLVTHGKTPAAYTHGNSLCENTVNRIRGLAGTLMNHVEAKLSIKLNTNHCGAGHFDMQAGYSIVFQLCTAQHHVNCTCSVMFNWGTSLMFYTLNILAQGDIHYFSFGLHIPQFFSQRLFGKFWASNYQIFFFNPQHVYSIRQLGHFRRGVLCVTHTQLLILHEHCFCHTS